jgi:hypothetical protein
VLALPCSGIVVVSPHPDDEVLGAGGLICSAARAGQNLIVLSVTDGEAAYPDWKGLDRIRQREVSDALNVLGPKHTPMPWRFSPNAGGPREAALFTGYGRPMHPEPRYLRAPP